MINEELVRRLAMGDPEAHKVVKDLPAPLQISFGFAADELRRKENIVPMKSGLEVFVEPEEKTILDMDEIGKNMLRIHEENSKKAMEAERIRQEHLEKQAKQMAERARAGITWY